MGNGKELEKLQTYRRKISEGAQGNIRDSIIKLSETVSMLTDIQEICTALFQVIEEQESRIRELETREANQDRLLESQQEYVARMKRKEEDYAKLEADSVKTVNIYHELNEKRSALRQEQEAFLKEKEDWKLERDAVLDEKRDAEEKCERLKKERNEAINSQDEAIKSKKEAVASMEKAKASLAEITGSWEKLKEEADRKTSEMEMQEMQIEELKQKVAQYEDKLSGYRNILAKIQDSQKRKGEKLGLGEEKQENEIMIREEEKRKQEEEKRKQEDKKRKEEEKIEQKISELEKKVEWYKNYAISLDQKVIAYFDKRSKELEQHCYGYLKNPLKAEERNQYFPEFPNERTRERLKNTGGIEEGPVEKPQYDRSRGY